MRIDHVVRAVADLDEAAGRLLRETGLASVPGGRHPGWGTANRIIPLGDQYLELLAVVDRDEAERSPSPFGRAVLDRLRNGEGWFRWCAGTDDVDAEAGRLGLQVTSGARHRPDGRELRWRSAGVAEAIAEPSLPFFIQWDVPADLHPGRTAAEHRVGASGVAGMDVGGDAKRLQRWTGGDDALSVSVIAGSGGILSVRLAVDGGDEVTLP